MNKILLDSSVIVDFTRVKNKDSSLLQSLVNQNYKLYISIITHTELFAGKLIWEKSSAKNELEVLLSDMAILELEENISMRAGEIKAKYNLDLIDAIIGATAILHNLDLVTLNIKDFEKIRGIKLFRL